MPDDLTFWSESRFGEAPTWAVVAQVLGSLAVMALGAHYFVEAVKSGSESLGIPAGLISLVLAPLATELPEKFNSVIWLRDNKDTLAIGNITGAMVFQSTIPVSLGLVYTSWSLDSLNALSAGLALLGGAGIIVMLLSRGGCGRATSWAAASCTPCSWVRRSTNSPCKRARSLGVLARPDAVRANNIVLVLVMRRLQGDKR